MSSRKAPRDDLVFFRALVVVAPIALVQWTVVVWAVLRWCL